MLVQDHLLLRGHRSRDHVLLRGEVYDQPVPGPRPRSYNRVNQAVQRVWPRDKYTDLRPARYSEQPRGDAYHQYSRHQVAALIVHHPEDIHQACHDQSRQANARALLYTEREPIPYKRGRQRAEPDN